MPERQFNVAIAPGQPAPATEAALVQVAELIRAEWISAASEHNDTGAYLAALLEPGALVYPYLGDVDAVAIINPLPQAYWLEYGRAGFHLPSHWGRGTGKWKLTRDGRRYATVPLRVRTPTAVGGGFTPTRQRMQMPIAVYRRAQQLQSGQRLGGFGERYKQSKSYNYYRQAFAGFPANLTDDGYTWKASPYENLLRTTAPTPGGGRHTTYMVFRTITPDSQGWYIPPTPAYHFAEGALEAAAPEITKMLDGAAAADMAAAIVDATKGFFQ